MLRNKSQRMEELFKSERMDIKKDFGITMKNESLKFKTDITYLLKQIVKSRYDTPNKNTPSPPPIPAYFHTPEQYFESFLPCFMEECTAKMRENLNRFKRNRYHSNEELQVKLNYLHHEKDNFCEYEIENHVGTADFLYRKNMVVVISNMHEPDVSVINQVQSEFCVIGILKEKGEIPNLITSTAYDKIILHAIRNKT